MTKISKQSALSINKDQRKKILTKKIFILRKNETTTNYILCKKGRKQKDAENRKIKNN